VVERGAATPDASGEAVPKSLQLDDAIIEVVTPVRRQSGPVPAAGCAPVSELIERVLDDPERDAHLLRGSDECHPTQGVPGVPALIARRPGETVSSFDEALDRVSALDYGASRPFLNHGPMACEAPDTAYPYDSARITPRVREVLAAKRQSGLASEDGGVGSSGHGGGQMVDQRFEDAGRQGFGPVASF
jgi:hypothetical protein